MTADIEFVYVVLAEAGDASLPICVCRRWAEAHDLLTRMQAKTRTVASTGGAPPFSPQQIARITFRVQEVPFVDPATAAGGQIVDGMLRRSIILGGRL